MNFTKKNGSNKVTLAKNRKFRVQTYNPEQKPRNMYRYYMYELNANALKLYETCSIFGENSLKYVYT